MVGWLKNESIRMIQIQRELSRTIAEKFMTAAWNMAHVFQHAGGPEIIEPLSEPFGPEGSVPPD